MNKNNKSVVEPLEKTTCQSESVGEQCRTIVSESVNKKVSTVNAENFANIKKSAKKRKITNANEKEVSMNSTDGAEIFPNEIKSPEDLKNIKFLPDDFELKSDKSQTQIDQNFASVSYWKEVRIRFFSNKSAVIASIAIIIIVILAFAGPHFNKYSYSEQNLEQKNYAPRIPGLEKLKIFDGDERLKTTSGYKKVNLYEQNGDNQTYYWFGSDTLGRDIWTRTWMGTRVSLYISIVAVLIDMIIGLSFGLISGYFGGMVDSVMQRFAEIVNGIPRLVIVTLLMLILKPGIATIIFALMITEWIGMSRIARAEMLNLKEREFVLASKTLGAKNISIIMREILPNINGQVITQTMFSIPTAIFTEAFLSFVGLGIPVPQCSLGSLISDAFNSFTTHPYQIIPPILVLAILMLSFNILADGLREALDPKFKEG